MEPHGDDETFEALIERSSLGAAGARRLRSHASAADMEGVRAEVEFCRETREIRRLWREACEGCGLCQWIATPSGWTVAVPAIRQITLGNPTVLTIHLRAGQLAADIEAVAAQIADAMSIGELRVKPLRGRRVSVELFAPTKPDTRVAPPVRSTRRTHPTKTWTNRWQARRLRRPEQPS